jgi:hypothetical protein
MAAEHSTDLLLRGLPLPLFSELPRARVLGNQFPVLGLLGNSSFGCIEFSNNLAN